MSVRYSVVDLRKLYFHSGYGIDQIIGTYTGSFVAVAPAPLGAPQRTTFVITTNIPESTFFQGIYSVDGGNKWYKFNTDTSSSVLGSEVNVYGGSNPDTFTLTAVNSTGSSPTAFTVMYRVALIAKPDQGTIDPQPTASNIVFNSRENYLKIVLDGTANISLGVGGTTRQAFVHGLGYFTQAIAYLETDATYGALPAALYELDTVMQFLSTTTVPNETNTASGSSGISFTNNSTVASIGAGATAFAGKLYVRTYGDD